MQQVSALLSKIRKNTLQQLQTLPVMSLNNNSRINTFIKKLDRAEVFIFFSALVTPLHILHTHKHHSLIHSRLEANWDRPVVHVRDVPFLFEPIIDNCLVLVVNTLTMTDVCFVHLSDSFC